MAKAPAIILRGETRGGGTNAVPLPVQAACKEWAKHHNKCEKCNRTDWFSPEKKYVCKKGRGLFYEWEQSVVRKYT